MLAKLKTYSLLGIEAMPVDVEVDLSPAPLPKTVIVGLPEQAVRESIHRIERALVNGGFMRPHDRVVINLAPADLPKQATSFDLPIAIGILVGAGQLESDVLEQYAAVGELSLEGQMRNVKDAGPSVGAWHLPATSGSPDWVNVDRPTRPGFPDRRVSHNCPQLSLNGIPRGG